ncbi:hypothetical protein [Streptacidiphilus anmyonensis]|uniref:hypothetical protein n=1 Tax=Streptacidiphilus anmyonensis TaxID=405782 RepID=UPI000693F50D|nr:hypothetical protein [Streptacidiphilus anmyonensis]
MKRAALHGGVESSDTGGRIRYRASWQQSLPLTLIFGSIFLMQLTNPLLWPHGRPGMPVLPLGWRILGLGLPVFTLVGTWTLNRHLGVTLTAEAAVVHNLRRRTIAWTDVSEVSVEPWSGGRRVVLCEANGRRTPLRMPSTGFLSWDRGLDVKVATIRGCWLANRGPAPAEHAFGSSGR